MQAISEHLHFNAYMNPNSQTLTFNTRADPPLICKDTHTHTLPACTRAVDWLSCLEMSHV